MADALRRFGEAREIEFQRVWEYKKIRFRKLDQSEIRSMREEIWRHHKLESKGLFEKLSFSEIRFMQERMQSREISIDSLYESPHEDKYTKEVKRASVFVGKLINLFGFLFFDDSSRRSFTQHLEIKYRNQSIFVEVYDNRCT